MQRSFASDNFAGIHPAVMEAISKANLGHSMAYGDDHFTKEAAAQFKELFGPDIEVFFVLNGTAANVLGLKTLMASHHAVLCADTAHINVDECGAVENYTGCKLITFPTKDGKLSIPLIQSQLSYKGNQHHTQPKVISITQATELGTVYQLKEIHALAQFAHQNQMFLHMDGARLSNAAVSLGATFKELTADCGVDVLSFGGTKNGMMIGEAVVFFNKKLAEDFKYIRKQGMQLVSKMRFISAQFQALLKDDLWKKNAAHANAMAKLLEQRVRKDFPQFPILYPVEANSIFLRLSPKIIPELQKASFFWVWDEANSIVRWMTSWDTTPEDIESFLKILKKG